MSFEQTIIIVAGAGRGGPRERPDRPVPDHPASGRARADQGPLRDHGVQAALHA
ncbi:hypothetical protein [Nonomuraea sp. NPDC050643]|uniref:hypothetical protein n=1 Tax=Nonomuraea sp. NPDC050643 TaxID=3155660 RepID=UPI0033FE07FA